MRVSLQEIEPGMRLSKPAFNLQGGLLLKEGEVITPEHLLLFKTWGVGQFEVEGKGEDKDGDRETNIEVEGIFSLSGGGEVVEEIKRVAKKMRVARREE